MVDQDAAAAQPDRPLKLATDRSARADRKPYAIVDIGSNSVRLVIYDELGRAPLPRFNEKSLCRLAEGLAETGAIAASGFQRTVETVRRFRAIADAMGVTRIDALATEATRKASNGPALVAAIAEATGLEVRVLSGVEEATYAALGVVSGFYRPAGVIGDMGGGSLELAAIDDDRVGEGCVSLPLGALPAQSLLAQYGENAKTEVDAILAASPVPALPKPVFYPVGGGWRAFAKAHMMANPTPVNVVHGYRLDVKEARDFARSLWRMNEKTLGKMRGVPARRVKTIAAAALVLDRVLKRLGPQTVVFSALGVREGWLYRQITPEERYFDPLVEGAQDFALPLARVPAFAAALEEWTAALFPGESALARRLRVTACALSDVGWRDHTDWRAAEWYRRLVQFPFIGLEHPERVFLAAAIHARYGGAPEDPVMAPGLALIGPEERRRALILGRAMQLGYRVSGGVPQILTSARVSLQGDRLILRVGRSARVPDSEVVSSRLQSLADAIGNCRPMIVETPDD